MTPSAGIGFRNLGRDVLPQTRLFRIPDTLTLSVVIPVYNERKTIHEILRRVRAVPVKKQIVLSTTAPPMARAIFSRKSKSRTAI